MRARRHEHGSLPTAPAVLLLVDVVNPLDFDGAENLVRPALAAAGVIARLKPALAALGVPAVYVNDNGGRWSSDFGALVAARRRAGGAAARLVAQVAPARGEPTLLKPRHSAFYGTPLQLLLAQIGAERLVVVGLAADLCVAFTAMDAYERGYALWVPQDCTAAESPARHRESMRWLRRALAARTDAAGPRLARGPGGWQLGTSLAEWVRSPVCESP